MEILMITLFVGPMKSNKTSTLIDVADCASNSKSNRRCIIFYPACCEKKSGYVISRDKGKRAKAVKVYDVNDLYNYIQDYDYIFIDEIQFLVSQNELDNLMDFLEMCDKNNKEVYLFGLPLDYVNKPFDVIQRVMPYVDSVVYSTSICEECGSKATRCVRYINGELDLGDSYETLIMEGHDVYYKSLCRKCYREITGLNAIK
jgi:thymidine kinase